MAAQFWHEKACLQGNSFYNSIQKVTLVSKVTQFTEYLIQCGLHGLPLNLVTLTWKQCSMDYSKYQTKICYSIRFLRKVPYLPGGNGLNIKWFVSFQELCPTGRRCHLHRTTWTGASGRKSLTHCGLLMPYCVGYLGQQWLVFYDTKSLREPLLTYNFIKVMVSAFCWWPVTAGHHAQRGFRH